MSTQPIPLTDEQLTEPVDAGQPTPTPPPAPTPDAAYTSKYRTREETERGIAEQDRYIETLKSQMQQYQQMLGQQLGLTPQAPAQLTPLQVLDKSVRELGGKPPQGETDFDRHIANLVRSEAQKIVEERFGSMSPFIGHASLDYAAEVASNDPKGDPNIRSFVKTPAFQKVLDENPVLREGVEAARTQGGEAATKYLPQFLSMAYKLHTATAAPAAPAVTQRTPPTPTMAPPPATAPTRAGERWADNDPRWNTPLSVLGQR